LYGKKEMTNKKRRDVVMSAPVVLQVESRYPKPSKFQKLLWRALVSTPGLAFVIGGIATREPRLMIYMGTCGFVLMTIMLIVIDKIQSSREHPLTFTKSGISAGRYINELWTDIESYRLIEANDLSRFTLSKDGVGTSLQLKNKGFSQRTVARTGSIFPTLGYFFDDNQVQQVREIFAEFGIKCTR
jgi:hypothetical protein